MSSVRNIFLFAYVIDKCLTVLNKITLVLTWVSVFTKLQTVSHEEKSWFILHNFLLYKFYKS